MATSNSTIAPRRLNIAKEVTAMERMTVDQLRARYAEVFGEQTSGRQLVDGFVLPQAGETWREKTFVSFWFILH